MSSPEAFRRAAVARPGHAFRGRNSKQGYSPTNSSIDILEPIVVVLIDQNDLVVRELLLSQRLKEPSKLICAHDGSDNQ